MYILLGLIFMLLFLKIFNSYNKKELFQNMHIKNQLKGLIIVFLLFFIPAVLLFLFIYNFTI